jgi:hypothetical protein
MLTTGISNERIIRYEQLYLTARHPLQLHKRRKGHSNHDRLQLQLELRKKAKQEKYPIGRNMRVTPQ